MPDHVGDALDGAEHDWTSPDAMRWSPPETSAAATAFQYLRRKYGTPTVADHHEWLHATWTPGFRRLTAAFQDTARAAAQLHQLGAAGLVPESPPEDPRERALWAAKRRGTGPPRTPAGRARRPRRHQ
jgi:hypothetical protein